MAQPDPAKISQTRERFLKKYNGNILDDTYDERDVTWVKTSDVLIRNALKTFKVSGDVEKAVDVLNEVLLFRVKYKLNDFKESDLNPELKSLDGVKFHGKDKEGRPVMHFQVCKQKKGHLLEEGRQYIAYKFNQHYMASPDQQIVALFDMTDAGIGNMDLDVTKFIIGCVSTYFPYISSYVIMFRMGAALEAIWMVIKQWLDADQSKNTHFCKRKDIEKYIEKDQLFPHMVKDEKSKK